MPVIIRSFHPANFFIEEPIKLEPKMASPSPKEVLTQIQSWSKNPPAEIANNRVLRRDLHLAARDLELRLEEPASAIHRLINGQNTVPMVLKVAFDIGLFPYLAKDSSPKSLSDIASSLNIDPVLLLRVVRFLAAEHIITEVDTDKYALSHSSGLLGEQSFCEAAQACGDIITEVFKAIPPFLAENGYRNPTDRRNGPGNKAFGVPDADLYDLFRTKFPEKMSAFGVYLGAFSSESAKPHELYPVQDRLIDGFEDSANEKLWIDIGGGMGFYSVAVQDAYPEFKGKFVVQEQDMMVHVAKAKGADKAIEFMTHDFLNEQPLKGARAYYFRNIFHNWGDADSAKILARTREAMKPGYSRLLIHDLVIPERGATPWEVTQDWLMMMGYCAHERTEKQWHELLGAAGLRINKIYKKTPGEYPIIEAEIAV